MYWSGLRLSAEVFLGSVHSVLRARRIDECGVTAWDDLWRSELIPPGDIGECDWPWYLLSLIAVDLEPLYRQNGPDGGSQPEDQARSVLGYVNHI